MTASDLPVDIVRPVATATRVSTFSAGRPAEPASRSWSAGPGTVAIGDISVCP